MQLALLMAVCCSVRLSRRDLVASNSASLQSGLLLSYPRLQDWHTGSRVGACAASTGHAAAATCELVVRS